MPDRREKILFVYQLDESSPFKTEGLWAKKIDDNIYQIDNIPFYIKNVALGDKVAVEYDEGNLYYDYLIEPSGRSVIQVIVFNKNKVKSTGESLEALGCDWESFEKLIAVDIPKDVNYSIIKSYLQEGSLNGEWDYREACLGFK